MTNIEDERSAWKAASAAFQAVADTLVLHMGPQDTVPALLKAGEALTDLSRTMRARYEQGMTRHQRSAGFPDTDGGRPATT